MLGPSSGNKQIPSFSIPWTPLEANGRSSPYGLCCGGTQQCRMGLPSRGSAPLEEDSSNTGFSDHRCPWEKCSECLGHKAPPRSPTLVCLYPDVAASPWQCLQRWCHRRSKSDPTWHGLVTGNHLRHPSPAWTSCLTWNSGLPAPALIDSTGLWDEL